MYSHVALLFILASFTPTLYGQQGVNISLKGYHIANNSFVDVDEIGERESALLCHTNNTDCCRSPYRAGEWYFPDRSMIQTEIWNYYYGPEFFYRDRNESVVRLNRREYPLERGHFQCEIPDANNITHHLSVNVLELGSITISPSGNHIHVAEEFFNLRCSITITPNPLPPNVPPPYFEWFFGPKTSSLPSSVVISPVTIDGNKYNSTLQFSPLRRFHAGSYTCRFGGDNRLVVTSKIITISVITGSGTTPIPGQNYTLICNISGVEYLDSHSISTIGYQWTKNNGTRTELGINSDTLYFTNLRLYDAGGYKCEVTINSQVFSYTEYLDIPIPKPISALITSDRVSPIRPIRSNVTLTCTVELSPLVDVPVTVNTLWTGPDRFFTTNTAHAVNGSTTTYTSTAMVSSFGRNQSGEYICSVTITSFSPFLTDSDTYFSATNFTVGVYLSLGGRIRRNNSVLLMAEVGETDIYEETTKNNSLQCITDRMPCCRFPYRAGEWIYRNGTRLHSRLQSDTFWFYRNRGFHDGTVNLNRPKNTLSPTGQFCCVVPDALDINQTLCVYIVSIKITQFGSTTAGEMFTMECSVNGSDATLQWFDDSGNEITSSRSRIVTTSSSVRQLRFSPLHQSHAGNYTCKATISEVTDSKYSFISVNAPKTSAAISSSGVPTPGGSYTLTCTISGTGNIRPVMNYQWTKNNGTQTQVGTNSNTLILTSLRLSDRGNYACTAAVTSEYLSGAITATSTSIELQLSIPPPTVCLVSDKPNPILSGTILLLTCSIEFSSVVDVPLSIHTVWTGPDDLNAPAPLPITGSLTHYTSSVQFSSVGLADSGNYTCTVNIGNGARITKGKFVTVGDGMFQLKLTRMEDCQRWTHDQAATYTDYIEEALVEAIKSQCKCSFSKENLLEESYTCDKSPNFTTYRNTLIGTDNFNSTQIITFIQDWVNSGPKIRFDWFTVRVDSTCSAAIATLVDPECGS